MLKIYVKDGHIIPIDDETEECLGLIFVDDADRDDDSKIEVGDAILRWYRGE